MANEFKYHRFGRYLILDHLVDGGMAKICRARMLGEQVDKIVAIKMIQPQYSNDNAFKSMFMDEIKVTFALNHPNIAQTFDYGMINGQLFTAMEFVDGANLKQFLDRLREKNYVFPVSISVHIISQVCQALHYAHTFTDKLSGKCFNIVHRDISPHNIMLTYDGAVKVIDFGIAKAETNSEATQAGTIKGKLSYLAPEYIEGLTLDHRYDQFAVGITLWELLCCRKLFTATNDLAVIKLIQSCRIPAPSSINPNVPKELDNIVLKALSKDRSLRYESMDQFNRALVKFLYSQYPDFNATDLSYFSKQLFNEEIKKDREKMLGFGRIDINPFLEELKNENKGMPHSVNGAITSPKKDETKTFVTGSKRIELELDLSNKGQEGIQLDTNKTKSKLQAKSGFTPAQRSQGNRTVTKKTDKTRTSIRVTEVKDSNSRTSSIKISISLVLAASLAAIYFLRPELLSLSSPKVEESHKARKISSQKTNPLEESSEGTLTISGLDPYMEVYIDGKLTSYSGVGVKIPAGRDVKIEIKKDGLLPYTATIAVGPDKKSVHIDVPELQVARYGILSFSHEFKEGTRISFKLNGQDVEKQVPIENMELPIGHYDMIIRDPMLGSEKSVKVMIEENKKFILGPVR